MDTLTSLIEGLADGSIAVVDLTQPLSEDTPLIQLPAFLIIMTVSGAVPRHSVGLVWFAAAAAGYLILLASDRRDELIHWGRVMPRSAGARPTPVQALSGRRIGVIAIVAALCIRSYFRSGAATSSPTRCITAAGTGTAPGTVPGSPSTRSPLSAAS